MPYLFNPPTVEEGPAGLDELFYQYRLPRGITVVRTGTKYSNVRFPTQDLLEQVDEYWMGGREHTVSDVVAENLTNAGYGNYLTEIV